MAIWHHILDYMESCHASPTELVATVEMMMYQNMHINLKLGFDFQPTLLSELLL